MKRKNITKKKINNKRFKCSVTKKKTKIQKCKTSGDYYSMSYNKSNPKNIKSISDFYITLVK